MNETCSLSQTEWRDYFLIAIEQAPLSIGSSCFLWKETRKKALSSCGGGKETFLFADNRLKRTAAGGVLFTRDKRVSCFSPSNGRKSSHESFSRDRGSGTFPLGGRKFVAFSLSLSGILFSTIVKGCKAFSSSTNIEELCLWKAAEEFSSCFVELWGREKHSSSVSYKHSGALSLSLLERCRGDLFPPPKMQKRSLMSLLLTD